MKKVYYAGFEPVSYTHLDVYKRQEQNDSKVKGGRAKQNAFNGCMSEHRLSI